MAESILEVEDSKAVEYMLRILTIGEKNEKLAALWCIGDLIACIDNYGADLIDQGLFDLVSTFLKSGISGEWKEALWIIANLMA